MDSFSSSIDSKAYINLARYFGISVIYPLIVLKSRAIARPRNRKSIHIWKSFTDITKHKDLLDYLKAIFFLF